MKKFLSILLALTIVLGLCACSGNNSDDDTGSVGADGKVTLTIGVASNAKVMSFKENALTKWLEEQCNVNLEFVEYAGGTDVATQISTTVAARQELPDILYGINLGATVANSYGRDGYFVDLTPYFEDKEGASATFWTRMAEELTEAQQSYVVRNITDADSDKIYGVPTIETSLIDPMKYQMWINTEWMETLGLSKPTNNEELYNVLVAFRDGDPNGNGQADEIPLYGSEKVNAGGDVLDFLLNLFIYYNDQHRWQFYNNSDELEFVYVQDEYREALKYINKLYEEGLLSKLCWTSSSQEMKTITTPSSGVALCGIFAAHLTSHTQMSNEVMYQYEPLQTWGYAVERDMNFNFDTFITTDCDNPDKAFELLMTMWSEEGSRRIRYGEYGVNWTDADEGAVSDLGLPAEYKLLSDPLTQQTTAWWGKVGCTLNVNAEGETAQVTEELDEWTATKSKMHAESRALFEEAAAKNNPEVLCPSLIYTEEEKEKTDMIRTNIGDLAAKAETEFMTGTGGRDINDDADWAAFVKEIEEMGLAEYQKLVNDAYDRG